MRSTVLITAAGPNWTLEACLESAVLERAIKSYLGHCPRLLVATRSAVREELIRHGFVERFPEIDFVGLPYETSGALATAVYALGALDIREGSLIISPGDTCFSSSEALSALEDIEGSGCSAGSLVFSSADPRFSYVSVDADGEVAYVAEKSVVSSLATTGNFYFADIGQFFAAAKWCFANNASLNGEFYVSTALNHYLFEGLSVNIIEVPSNIVNKSWV